MVKFIFTICIFTKGIVKRYKRFEIHFGFFRLIGWKSYIALPFNQGFSSIFFFFESPLWRWFLPHNLATFYYCKTKCRFVFAFNITLPHWFLSRKQPQFKTKKLLRKPSFKIQQRLNWYYLYFFYFWIKLSKGLILFYGNKKLTNIFDSKVDSLSQTEKLTDRIIHLNLIFWLIEASYIFLP